MCELYMKKDIAFLDCISYEDVKKRSRKFMSIIL